MAVTFDAANAGNNGGSGNIATVALTVGSGANQAVLACMSTNSSSDVVLRVTCDGVRMTLVPYADTVQTAFFRNLMFVTTGLAPGSHTFVASGQTDTFVILGLASFFGVHQERPVDQVHALFATATSTSPSIVIPSQPGDMTVDFVSDIPDVPGSPTQTEAWVSAGAASSFAAAIGSSNTHGWTLNDSTTWLQCGAALKAVGNQPGFGFARL